MKLTKCAPCSSKVPAKLAGHGLAKAAKCKGVFPASSLALASAPTVSKALANCGDGNWHAGYLPTNAASR